MPDGEFGWQTKVTRPRASAKPAGRREIGGNGRCTASPSCDGHQRVVEAVRRVRVDDAIARPDAGANDQAEQLVGTVADQDVLATQAVRGGGAVAQHVRQRIGIEAQILAGRGAQRLDHPRRRRIRVLVGVELDVAPILRLLAGHVARHRADDRPREGLAHGRRLTPALLADRTMAMGTRRSTIVRATVSPATMSPLHRGVAAGTLWQCPRSSSSHSKRRMAESECAVYHRARVHRAARARRRRAAAARQRARQPATRPAAQRAADDRAHRGHGARDPGAGGAVARARLEHLRTTSAPPAGRRCVACRSSAGARRAACPRSSSACTSCIRRHRSTSRCRRRPVGAAPAASPFLSPAACADQHPAARWPTGIVPDSGGTDWWERDLPAITVRRRRRGLGDARSRCASRQPTSTSRSSQRPTDRRLRVFTPRLRRAVVGQCLPPKPPMNGGKPTRSPTTRSAMRLRS